MAAGTSGVAKHSLLIAGHRTSISLEDVFWRALHEHAAARGIGLAALVGEIDAGRGDANLSSAIRVYLFETASGERQRQPSVSPES